MAPSMRDAIAAAATLSSFLRLGAIVLQAGQGYGVYAVAQHTATQHFDPKPRSRLSAWSSTLGQSPRSPLQVNLEKRGAIG